MTLSNAEAKMAALHDRIATLESLAREAGAALKDLPSTDHGQYITFEGSGYYLVAYEELAACESILTKLSAAGLLEKP